MSIFNSIVGSESNSGKLNLLYEGDVVGDGTRYITINFPVGLETSSEKTYILVIKATDEVNTRYCITSAVVPITFYNNNSSAMAYIAYGTALYWQYQGAYGAISSNHITTAVPYTSLQFDTNATTYKWASGNTYHWELYEYGS